MEDIAVLTVKDAIDLGQSKEHNTYTEEKYAVTGVIVVGAVMLDVLKKKNAAKVKIPTGDEKKDNSKQKT